MFSLSFLISSNNSCFGQDKMTYSNNYEVIYAVTGKKIGFKDYAEEPVLQTHHAIVSAVKKAFAEEGVDASAINISLYYADLFPGGNLPRKNRHSVSSKNTILSPWMKLTKTVSNSGATGIEIHFDVTHFRLVFDLFSESNDKTETNNFLEIPFVSSTCMKEMTEGYTDAVQNSEDRKVREIPDAFSCAPESVRQPLLSLFKSSPQDFVSPFVVNVMEELIFNCQDAARQYYSELYPRLAVKALQILESESNLEPMWWTKVVEQAKPIQQCQ